MLPSEFVTYVENMHRAGGGVVIADIDIDNRIEKQAFIGTLPHFNFGTLPHFNFGTSTLRVRCFRRAAADQKLDLSVEAPTLLDACGTMMKLLDAMT